MPSPFLGMDPYLEGELWQEFHETLAGEIRAQLLPHLPPKYVALLAKRYVLDRPSLGIVEPPQERIVYPEVHVVEPAGQPSGVALVPASVGVAEPTVVPPSPYIEEVPHLVWAIPLEQPLTTVPVPLLEPDPDVMLDLQAAVNGCFDLVGYERLLDYSDLPPGHFEPEESEWIVNQLNETGYRQYDD